MFMVDLQGFMDVRIHTVRVVHRANAHLSRVVRMHAQQWQAPDSQRSPNLHPVASGLGYTPRSKWHHTALQIPQVTRARGV